MEMPDTIKTYCPYCKTVTVHKVKPYKKGKTRTLSRGQRHHEEKTKGYTSKIAGKVPVYKQAKRQTVILECTVCHKKHYRTIGSRTKKTLQLEKVER